MAEHSTCPPLVFSSVEEAYSKIKQHVHKTPLITSRGMNSIASRPNPASDLGLLSSSSLSSNISSTNSSSQPPLPKFNLYFKAESQQRIGAFKARGAFHALTRLVSELGLSEVQKRGVTTHSSGNHAQALALAAHTFNIPSYIVMPTISTSSKIAGTRIYTPNVIFSGSTSDEREAKVAEVIKQTGAILVPPYDHPDIILGQGTAGLEMESQLREILNDRDARFDAVIAPLGGGGLLSGTATWFSHTHTHPSTTSTSDTSKPRRSKQEQKKTLVFGAEPSFSGANDAQRGLTTQPQPTRIASVSSLTIADGLRTPVGHIPWSIISSRSPKLVEGVYSVSEDEIKAALRIMMQTTKLFLEPSAVVGLAVVLFCKEFRELVAKKQKEECADGGEARPWDVGIILSGGNTTVEALAELFGSQSPSPATTMGKENDVSPQAKL